VGTLIFLVCFGTAIASLLALDWFMAGRKRGRRTLRSAADGQAGNANAGYAAIQRIAADMDQKHHMP
jgi:hypothetical protein